MTENYLNFAGQLITLVASLWDERCPPLERKINQYLMNATRSDLSFFMHSPLADADLFIQVIGDVELSESIRVPIESDFSRRLMKANGPICTGDELYVELGLLKCLKKQLKNTENEIFHNLLIIPFSTNDCPRPSCYYALVNSSLRIGALDRNKTLVYECLMFCKAIVLNTYVSDLEKVHSDMCSNVLTNTVLAFSTIDNEAALATVLQQQAAKMMNASFSKVYFFREIKKKELAIVLEVGQPTSKLLTPQISEINLRTYVSTPEIIINKEPSKAFHFSEIVKKDFKKIKTLMSFPTFYCGDANGHMEVMNKKISGGFNRDDEDYARCLGAINGLAVEAMWKLREFRLDNSRRDAIDCILMRRAGIHCERLHDVLYCQDLHSYDYLLEYRFRPYDVPEEHVLCILMGMFDELDFIQSMKLDEPVLLRFLMSLRKAYGNLPYHNWYHGFGSAHFVFVLIYRLSLLKQGVLTEIEGFALLLAALTHDVDFRGCTTQFQLYAGENMASLYSSAGGVQQRLALTVVLQMITHPRCNLLSKLDLDDFKNFVNVFQILMLDANLAYHMNKMSEIYLTTFRAYDRNYTQDVRMLLSLLLTCSDLSDYTRPWYYFVEIHERQMGEYFRENQNSSDGVFELDEAVLTPKVQMELQANFIRCLILPLFENLYIKYPTTYECHKRAEVNLEILDELIDTLDKYPEHTLADLYRAH